MTVANNKEFKRIYRETDREEKRAKRQSEQESEREQSGIKCAIEHENKGKQIMAQSKQAQRNANKEQSKTVADGLIIIEPQNDSALSGAYSLSTQHNSSSSSSNANNRESDRQKAAEGKRKKNNKITSLK